MLQLSKIFVKLSKICVKLSKICVKVCLVWADARINKRQLF